ncbi:hypothetical protein DL771_007014 [Monosporascus sp. 5C6A]|nr:hypothetical protein DL771_007014 [Monosporascus sp. 5C6A]
MRFIPALAAALAYVASASPVMSPASSAMEKRTGGNGPACIAFCWSSCIAPGACVLCMEACMLVADPIKEFDPTKVPGVVTPAE